ncbi:hypothetical protein B0H15DRAFT_957301 [Mycena belliarum]|uniref:Uncharacterized protein n=1 Tax=Mycena belliarum TaxID=1033014 RepID=A0AAD6XGV4_9AGAR|nr:hypothetical protein B0H15DRAFT_957301 [Mycena belliae]
MSTSMSSQLLAVNLATLAVASLFYGMFLVLSATSMYLLVGRYLASRRARSAVPGRQRSIFRSTVFIAAIGLFCAVTAHWITTVYRAFLAFIHFQGGALAAEFYADTAQATEFAQEAFLMVSVLIGDSLIIHRLWVVWEHRTGVVVFPICSLAALTLCSAVSMYTLSRKSEAREIFADPWLTSNCVLTLLTNVYSTALITYKIWRITRVRVARPIGGSNLRDFLVIVVESAALYASWAIFFTATYQARSLVQFVVIQSAPQVVGIVNALIQTRVGLGWAIEAHAGSPPPSAMAFAKRAGTEVTVRGSGEYSVGADGGMSVDVCGGGVGRTWAEDRGQQNAIRGTRNDSRRSSVAGMSMDSRCSFESALEKQSTESDMGVPGTAPQSREI